MDGLWADNCAKRGQSFADRKLFLVMMQTPPDSSSARYLKPQLLTMVRICRDICMVNVS